MTEQIGRRVEHFRTQTATSGARFAAVAAAERTGSAASALCEDAPSKEAGGLRVDRRA